MGWFAKFFSFFRKQKEATPEQVAEHFERIKAAPKDERRKLTQTLRPAEASQMLSRTLMHIEAQTAQATEEVLKAGQENRTSVKKMLATSGQFKAVK